MLHKSAIVSLGSIWALAMPALVAEARVTQLEITSRQVVLGGHSFANSGPYEKLRGIAHFEVDPQDPRNAVVFDLDNAPLNTNALVEFSADFYILKPVDLTMGNGDLLLEVNNHGNKQAMWVFNDATGAGQNDPTAAADFGNGFLMRSGYTVAWVGWEALVNSGANRMTVGFPVATDNGAPLSELILIEQVDALGAAKQIFTRTLSGNAASKSYESISTDQGEAQAELRVRSSDSPRPPSADIPAGDVIPLDQWSFANCPNGPPGVPSKTDICLAGGFQNDKVYQLIYRATKPPVSGLGYVTTRDFVSFLHNELDGSLNPVAGITTTLCQGNSQSGKYLRDFLYQGFNEDEQGLRVCDGVLVHAAGAHKLALNYRFAASFKAANEHANRAVPNDTFPRTYAVRQHPLDPNVLDGILKRPWSDPKVFQSDTSYEYRQFRTSAVDTDEDGNDVDQPDNVRRYQFSGLEHSAGPGAIPNYGIANRECQQLSNPTHYGILMRALLVALDGWVRDGVEPPGSRVPRVQDGTLISADEYCAEFPQIPGVACNGIFNAYGERDFGPRARNSSGVIDYLLPYVQRENTVLVPRADSIGNDIGGVRHPFVEAPAATLTGWNLRTAEFGEGELCNLVGMSLPLARSRAIADQNGDPRVSLEELYGDHQGYVRAVAAAARQLWADGFLLAEDVFRTVQQADASNVLQ